MSFNFQKQLAKGHEGEAFFLSTFKYELEKLPGRGSDFITKYKVSNLFKLTVELKTDYYDSSKTENFFMERWSDTEAKKPGGVWQAAVNKTDIFVYMFNDTKHAYFFDTAALLKKMEELETGGKLKVRKVANRAWVTTGFLVPRNLLKDVSLETVLSSEGTHSFYKYVSNIPRTKSDSAVNNNNVNKETGEIKMGQDKDKKLPIKTNYCFIVDSSGSMNTIKSSVIAAINENIRTIREATSDQISRVSLFTFANEVTEKFFDRGVESLIEFDYENYKPAGGTAMYDGVGFAINRLKSLPDANDENVSTIVLIFSDGEENVSKVFKRNDLAELVQTVTATKRWTFTFLGANVNLAEVAPALNIPVANCMAFTADSLGTLDGGIKTSGAIRSYISQRNVGATCSSNFYSVVESVNQQAPAVNADFIKNQFIATFPFSNIITAQDAKNSGTTP